MDRFLAQEPAQVLTQQDMLHQRLDDCGCPFGCDIIESCHRRWAGPSWSVLGPPEDDSTVGSVLSADDALEDEPEGHRSGLLKEAWKGVKLDGCRTIKHGDPEGW